MSDVPQYVAPKNVTFTEVRQGYGECVGCANRQRYKACSQLNQNPVHNKQDSHRQLRVK